MRILSREGVESQVSGAGVVALWLEDLGGHPSHGKILGGFPGPVGETSDWAAPAVET